MRTYFTAGVDEIDAVRFANAILARRQADAQKLRADLGFLPRDADELLDLVLGDPSQAVDDPVFAFVNASEWKARCECGGVEYVDMEMRLFMCCSCWNRRHAHAWRRVVVPAERHDIERILLARPNPLTRHWKVDEPLGHLLVENLANRIPIDEGDVAIVAALDEQRARSEAVRP